MKNIKRLLLQITNILFAKSSCIIKIIYTYNLKNKKKRYKEATRWELYIISNKLGVLSATSWDSSIIITYCINKHVQNTRKSLWLPS